MSKYKFSIIIAVYNMERYIRETIESILSQTIGYRSVQVILVNDGSTDGSGTVCKDYEKQYSNIVYIEKENGGVSSARNAGLAVAKGELVNFLDADDKLSADTLEAVYRFYKKHKQEADVYAVPMLYFEGKEQEHALNFKFHDTRIVDLQAEPSYIQLSASSAFVVRRAVGDLQFQEDLRYGEDTDFITRLILPKMKCGFIAEGKYLYRYRNTQDSAIQQSKTHKDNYMKIAKTLFMGLIQLSLETTGAVCQYVQYIIAYNLGWRIRVPSIEESVMDKEELTAYIETVREILQYIEDDILLRNPFLGIYYKIYELELKYNEKIEALYRIVCDTEHCLLCYGSYLLNDLSRQVVHIDSVEDKMYYIHIKGRMSSLFPAAALRLIAVIDGSEYEIQTVDIPENHIYSLNRVIRPVLSFALKVDAAAEAVEHMQIYAEFEGCRKVVTIKREVETEL